MKTLLALIFLSVASVSFASEQCTYSIKDQYGYEFENHTRISYSQSAACSDAEYACRVALSEGQRRGQYFDATCVQTGGVVTPTRPPFPPTSMAMCTTDLVDYYGRIVRSFSGNGSTQWEACNQSEQFCNYELSRDTSRGYRCVSRNGNGGNYPQPPRPPSQITETCRASRFDPSGYYIESYMQTYTGPYGSDVKGEACRRAYNQCSYEIRGRQTCRIEG